MAYLTDFQVDAIRSHMTGEKELLLKKFRAKNSPFDKISVPIGEMSAYEALGFKVDDTTKKKAKMSRRKAASKEFEDDILCMFYNHLYYMLDLFINYFNDVHSIFHNDVLLIHILFLFLLLFLCLHILLLLFHLVLFHNSILLFLFH